MAAYLGLFTQAQAQQSLTYLIEKALKNNIDQIVVDQVCDIAQRNPQISFSPNWVQDPKILSSEYLPYILSCFKTWGTGLETWLKNMDLAHLPSSRRREILKALKNRWNVNDEGVVIQHLSQVSNTEEAYEFYSSAQVILKEILTQQGSNSQTSQLIGLKIPFFATNNRGLMSCLSDAARLANSDMRDGARWKCHESLAQDDLWSCLKVSSSMEKDQSGLDWQCLLKPQKEAPLSLCLDLAERNPDPEKSDDMLWTCWDQKRQSRNILKAECLRLASSMKIEGNRIKANWNCMNMKTSTIVGADFKLNSISEIKRLPASK